MMDVNLTERLLTDDLRVKENVTYESELFLALRWERGNVQGLLHEIVIQPWVSVCTRNCQLQIEFETPNLGFGTPILTLRWHHSSTKGRQKVGKLYKMTGCKNATATSKNLREITSEGFPHVLFLLRPFQLIDLVSNDSIR